MKHLSNTEIHKLLLDASEEASRIDSATSWTPIGKNWWLVSDKDGHHIGWVDATINCCDGLVTFKYRCENTYTGIAKVDPVTVDAANLTDDEELQKLIDFDSSIAEVHQL